MRPEAEWLCLLKLKLNAFGSKKIKLITLNLGFTRTSDVIVGLNIACPLRPLVLYGFLKQCLLLYGEGLTGSGERFWLVGF